MAGETMVDHLSDVRSIKNKGVNTAVVQVQGGWGLLKHGTSFIKRRHIEVSWILKSSNVSQAVTNLEVTWSD